MKTFVTAAASVAIIAATTLSAVSASQADTRSPRAKSVKSLTISGKPTTAPFDNTAKAWTSACYAEFGPNATNPDAALLEKCLNY